MNTITTNKLISLRELALVAFAAFLLAAAPDNKTALEVSEQPVKVTVPVDQAQQVEVNRA